MSEPIEDDDNRVLEATLKKLLEKAVEYEKLRLWRERMLTAMNASEQTLRLHVGEMTAQELRTVRSVVNWMKARADNR